MALAYTTSPAYHLIAEDDDSKAAAIFEEGHYMQVEVAAMTATSDQPELAREFLAFMLTDGFQGVIPTTNWMYPAHTPAAGLPEGYATLAVPEKPLLFSPEEARGEARGGAGGMAGGAQPIAAPVGPAVRWGGGLALALVAALTLGTVAALVSRAEPGRGLGPAEWAALRFTLEQALISAALSCLFAVPAARALARRRFFGRGVLVALLGAPFLLPAIVAVFGIVGDLGARRDRQPRARGAGRAGARRLRARAAWCWRMSSSTWRWWRGWCCRAGSPSRPSSSAWRRSSGSRPRDVFRRIEAPMLREVLPGAFVLVFLLCMTSFAVALTLGGGPRATTLELAIYQAVRFDFDLGRAAWLALIQFALCGGVTLAGAAPLGAAPASAAGSSGGVRRWDADGARLRVLDGCVLAALALFLGLPLAAVVAQGAAGVAAGLPAAVWPAALRSLGVALGSAALALALGLGLAALRRRAAGAGRRAVDRGGGADDARGLAVRGGDGALHPALSARRSLRAGAAGDGDGQRRHGAPLRAARAAAGADRGAGGGRAAGRQPRDRRGSRGSGW